MAIVYAETIPTQSIGRVRFSFRADGTLVAVKLRSDSRNGGRGKASAAVPSRAKLERWLKAYLAGRDLPFPGKWSMPGKTGFAQSVYAAVADLKAGETLSYADVAARAGSAKACRAVGTAMGRNPIPLVVP
jgi:methylated-DNA-[protein]-cysteine S-methyltransferase